MTIFFTHELHIAVVQGGPGSTNYMKHRHTYMNYS